MYQVIKQITFCYGHRLMNYVGKCQHLHGHDAVAEIVLFAQELDPRGMVVDFVDIKLKIKQWIDDEMDHKMLLCKNDSIVPVLTKCKEPLYLMEHNPTAENIAKEIFIATQRLGFPVREVRLWESPSSCAIYSDERIG